MGEGDPVRKSKLQIQGKKLNTGGLGLQPVGHVLTVKTGDKAGEKLCDTAFGFSGGNHKGQLGYFLHKAVGIYVKMHPILFHGQQRVRGVAVGYICRDENPIPGVQHVGGILHRHIAAALGEVVEFILLKNVIWVFPGRIWGHLKEAAQPAYQIQI